MNGSEGLGGRHRLPGRGRLGRVGRLCGVLVCLLWWSPLAIAVDPPPALMHASRFRADIDPAAYWISEKLDGVRAHWDGERLRFRSGAPIAAPAWFVAALPAQPLDGELWMGRGGFEHLVGIVRQTQPDDAGWRALRYMVFDLPGADGSFDQRVERIRALVAAVDVPWLAAVEQFRVRDRGELMQRLEAVLAGGGEGLMLHRADARWTAGRSDAILKLTPWLDDEARVVGHLPGKGRLAGMLGALLVETADGRRFRLGSGFTDAQRRSPPAPGALVTYRYRELTARGLPRFPRFLRVRELP